LLVTIDFSLLQILHILFANKVADIFFVEKEESNLCNLSPINNIINWNKILKLHYPLLLFIIIYVQCIMTTQL